MNLTILKGNVGQDPVIKVFPEGGKICKFSLATSESYTNKQGEKVTNTDWHNIVFNGAVCDTIEKWVKKGSQLVVTGKIKYRTYEDKEGVTKNTTEILCSTFEFCGSAEKKEDKGNLEGKYQKGGKEVPAHIEEQQTNSADDLSDIPF